MEENLDCIEVKNSPIHEKGIFAKKEILKNTRIIKYIGKKISKAQAEKIAKQSEKVYVLDIGKRYDLDGSVKENIAKFANHSCIPNCDTDGDEKGIWIKSKGDIKKGEEITFNYGYDLDDFEKYLCACSSDKCVGYIMSEKLWQRLFKKRKKQILKNQS